ncbi:MAG: GAF domain-containing sensor histidine kinase [Marmoricola sp.]
MSRGTVTTIPSQQRPMPTHVPKSAEALLRAVLAISGELDLRSVLVRVIEAAAHLTDARYGALGVVGSDGQLSEFITTGLEAETEAAIGPRPRGKGLLGLLLEHPHPIRLDDLGEHPASVGMPANHPPMGSFLGVPIRIRGTVFGNLYLTDKAGGAFTENDEQLVLALARAAALVIDNARTYRVSERRRQWLEASAELANALQPPITLETALEAVVVRARATCAARASAVLQLPEGGHPVITAFDGDTVEDVREVIRRIISDVRTSDSQAVALDFDLGDRIARVIPMRAQLADPGVLLLILDRDGATDQEEREMLAGFVDQAGMALDRAQAFADRDELVVVKERARIARDLHDVVIQRLFAAGMKLQALRRSDAVGPEQLGTAVDELVGDLDTTIANIRTTIFGLQKRSSDSLRGEVIALVEEYAGVLGARPSLRTDGMVDLMVPTGVGENLLAVLREALSNVARHAQTNAVWVEVRVSGSAVTLEVCDRGRGIPAQRVESGLRNARERASELGGTLEVALNPDAGTTLRWSCPIAQYV